MRKKKLSTGLVNNQRKHQARRKYAQAKTDFLVTFGVVFVLSPQVIGTGSKD